MLDDPRVNFAISAGQHPSRGIQHLGVQVESTDELSEVYGRLEAADRPILEEGRTICCYAKSEKSWITDPDGLVWETFFTDGEATTYGDSPALGTLLDSFSRDKCCLPKAARMSRTYKVLFLCTGNSARSILAEAILNKEGAGRFRAFSAGSFPKGQVHPAALSLPRELGYPADGLRSKSWDEFAANGAPSLDFIFTVCDNAAGEACPIWPGEPVTAHWGIEDPADVEGQGERAAFWTAYQALQRRIGLFLALPLASIDEMTLTNRLREIGKAELPVE